MSKPPLSRKTLLTPAALGLAAAVLSACSGAGTAPGVAAQVGDGSISHAQVDEATADLCHLSPEASEPSERTPRSQQRQEAVKLLVWEAEAEQLAAARGLEPGVVYHQEMARIGAQLEQLPDDVRAKVLDLASGPAKRWDLIVQLGTEALEDEGITPTSQEEVLLAGEEVFKSWSADQDIEIDPRYGLEVVDGEIVATDSDLSVPVDEFSAAGAKSLEDFAQDPAAYESYAETYIKNLPAALTCG